MNKAFLKTRFSLKALTACALTLCGATSQVAAQTDVFVTRHASATARADNPATANIAMQETPSLIVNTLQDVAASDGETSLREAIAYANSKIGDDTIQFQAGLGGTIILNSALPSLSTPITISGPGADVLAVSGNNAVRVFHVARATVTISGLTIRDGLPVAVPDENGMTHAVDESGGGVLNEYGTLTVLNCTFTANLSPAEGAAICNYGFLDGGAAALTVRDCTFTNNEAGTGGGVYSNGRYGSVSAAIYNSTFLNNRAGSYGGGIASNGMGGNATLTVSQCTFAGNRAVLGGGVSNDGRFEGSASLSLMHSTFSGNFDSDVEGVNVGSGAGVFNEGGATQLKHCLFAGESRGGQIDGFQGSLSSLGYNLSTDSGKGFLNGPGDLINTDPKLDVLANNGGPTQTMALQVGSPAIDAGDPQFAGSGLFEQRGPNYPRVRGSRVDIGAVEGNSKPVVDLNGAGTGINSNTNFKPGSETAQFAANALVRNDEPTLAFATVTLINPQNGASEVLSATASGAIAAGNITYFNGVLSINKVAPVADYQAVLRTLSYSNSAVSPTGISRSINVVVNDGVQNSPVATAQVNYLFKPVVSRLSSLVGKTGKVITIDGKYFTGVTDVKFNTTSVPAAGITLLSDTRLQVKVPAGAASGPVHVTTPGGTGSSSASFVVDNSAPAVAIISPAADAFLTSLSSVSGTAADEAAGATGGSGLRQVYVRIRRSSDNLWWTSTGWSATGDSSSVFPATINSATGTWSSNVSAAALPVGTYLLYAYAADQAGNSRYVSRRVSISAPDTTAPTITMSSPAAGSTVSSLASISGSAADEAGGSGVRRVYVRIRRTSDNWWWKSSGWTSTIDAETTLAATYNSSTGAWTCSSGPSALPAGTYLVYAYAVDAAGNNRYISHRVTFSPPGSTSMAATETTSASTVKLSSAVLQGAAVQLRFTGALEAAGASEAAIYHVLVNGEAMEVESVRYEASSRVVTLSLAESVLQAGDEVEVSWSDLRDAQGRFLRGKTAALTVR